MRYAILTLIVVFGGAGFFWWWLIQNVEEKAPVIITHPTEYHFNVDSEGYDIYTEDMKFVGRLKYGQNPTLDSLINADNQ